MEAGTSLLVTWGTFSRNALCWPPKLLFCNQFIKDRRSGVKSLRLSFIFFFSPLLASATLRVFWSEFKCLFLRAKAAFLWNHLNFSVAVSLLLFHFMVPPLQEFCLSYQVNTFSRNVAILPKNVVPKLRFHFSY